MCSVIDIVKVFASFSRDGKLQGKKSQLINTELSQIPTIMICVIAKEFIKRKHSFNMLLA